MDLKIKTSRKISELKNVSQFNGLALTEIGSSCSKQKPLFKSSSHKEITWRPTIKILAPKMTLSPKISRKLKLDEPLPPLNHAIRKKPTKEAPFNLPYEYEYHTNIVRNNDGNRIHDYYSYFYHVESKMGRKHRVPEITQKRNSLSYVSLGDKPYIKPEQSSGFFLQEGLIPGVDHKYSISARYLKNLPNKFDCPGIYTSIMKIIKKK